jgi:hypothetical protein
MRKGLNTAAAAVGAGRKGRGSLINAMKINNAAALNQNSDAPNSFGGASGTWR